MEPRKKLSALGQASTFEQTAFLLKILAGGAGDQIVPLSSVPLGYVLNLATGASHNPADATNYYFGGAQGLVSGAQTSAVNQRVYIPRAGAIKAIYGVVYVAGTLATAGQNATMYLRLNDTTDVSLTTDQAYSAIQNAFTFTDLDIDVVAGDFITAKILTPTWTTNPTTVFYQMSVFIGPTEA